MFEGRVSAGVVTLKGCQIVAGGRARARPPEPGIHELRTLKGVPEPAPQTAMGVDHGGLKVFVAAILQECREQGSSRGGRSAQR